MPYSIEHICLIVKYKAQNNAKDSKGLKHSHVRMNTFVLGKLLFFVK